jgi:hypothetical protein
MNRVVVITLLVFSAFAFAQTSPIPSGSTVYIEPMDGYESYLAAALAKKHVPLMVLSSESTAQYVIKSTVSHAVPSSPNVVVNNTNNVLSDNNDTWAQSQQRAAARAAARAALGSTNSSISVIDPRTSQIVFAYSVDKHGTTHQSQSAAEACAKHLKEFIEKAEKPKK